MYNPRIGPSFCMNFFFFTFFFARIFFLGIFPCMNFFLVFSPPPPITFLMVRPLSLSLYIYITLTKVYHQSLQQGIVPDLLKLSKVTPIDKGGDSTDATNFRPISTLSAFIHIFENLVYKQLVNYKERGRLNWLLLRSQIS